MLGPVIQTFNVALHPGVARIVHVLSTAKGARAKQSRMSAVAMEMEIYSCSQKN